MTINPWFDPIIFSVGPLAIRWYGLMYVIGFVLGSNLLKYLFRKKFWPLDEKAIENYVTALILGMFFGARFAYVFIYNWDYYSQNLGEILSVWQGGLSFHGAVAGMCLSTYLFAKKHKVRFLQLTDCLAVAGTQGLFFGRVGNFINAELYGRITTSSLGFIFPGGGPLPRHASQLYEGILEGIILFIFLFWLHRRQKIYGMVSTAFMAGYGIFRFIVEFFREPDSQLGYYFGGITMGQILCFMMILLSGLVFYSAKKQNTKNPIAVS